MAISVLARPASTGTIGAAFVPEYAYSRSGNLDCGALNVFLRTGFWLQDETPFMGLRARPAPSISIKPASLSRDQVIDAYIDLFRASVNRMSAHDGYACLGLSGGRDSRHILLELHRLGRVPACFTVEFPHAPEVEVATQIANRLGASHVVLRQPHDLALAETNKNKLCNYATMEHGLLHAARPFVLRYHAMWDGIAGDMLSAGLQLTPERVQMLRESRIDKLVRSFFECLGPIAGVRDQSLFSVDDALHRVSEEFRRHLNQPNPITAFFLWCRTRRIIAEAPYSTLNDGSVQVLAPYLDDELFHLLYSLPPEMTVDHKLHDDAIARAFPEFADMPYAGKSKMDAAFVYRLARQTLRYVATSPAGLLCKRTVVKNILAHSLMPNRLNTLAWDCRSAIYLSQVGSR
jgi:asparagine synthase (glutamine-hydrolysing)